MGVVLVVVIVQKLKSIELVVVPTNVCLVQRGIEDNSSLVNEDFGVSYIIGFVRVAGVFCEEAGNPIGCAVLPTSLRDNPKLTIFKAFVNWHVDIMRDSFMTILFCLFCFAVAGLLLCALAFGRHGDPVRAQDGTEREKTLPVIDEKRKRNC